MKQDAPGRGLPSGKWQQYRTKHMPTMDNHFNLAHLASKRVTLFLESYGLTKLELLWLCKHHSCPGKNDAGALSALFYEDSAEKKNRK
ncbi:hypothetical protein [Maribacter sp. 2307ULW6-5]|uniref:hypothetical protein n=1 Tax=Maribacter sp. 2307ULW6-5 TaxID=3386275 RepID=UPI0039BC8A39